MESNALLKTLEQLLHKIKANRRREMRNKFVVHTMPVVGGPKSFATNTEMLEITVT